MESQPRFEGGCFCGAVRYRAARDSGSVSICHCEHCRRASGAPLVAWVGVRRDEFEWTAGEPGAYHHTSDWPTPIRRTFCADCGTSLTYEREGSEYLDVTAASMDDPEAARPSKHVFVSRQLSWISLVDDMPRHDRLPPDSK